ncbi:MAG: Crp/Fnr family transcriptional regulator [Chloroflexota bacterium]|nr:Crp/Fnr family transcriptional regulator [Chloroflexota bacterium]
MGLRLDDDTHVALAASRLGALPEDVLGDLLAGATRVTIAARSTVRPVAGRSPHLELVVSGLVRIQVAAPDGRALTVRYCRRGALMGAATLYAEAVRPFTIQALTDAALLRLDPARVLWQARRDPRVANALLAETSERVMTFVAEFSGHAFGTVRQRIARHLLDLASLDPHSEELAAAISQQELADAVGTVREVVVRVLRELRMKGCIRTRRDGIVIVDPERLSAIAAEER